MEERFSRENAPSDARTKAVIRLAALLTVVGLLVLILGAVLGSLPLLVGGGVVFAAAGLGVLAVRRTPAGLRGTTRERAEERGTAAAETSNTVSAEQEREEEPDEEKEKKKKEKAEERREPEPEPEAADAAPARQETEPEAPREGEHPEAEAANALRNAVRELLSSLPEREAPLEKAIAYCLSRTDSADDPRVRDEAEKLAREHVTADERILCVALSGSREDEGRPALLVLTDHGAAVSDNGMSHRFVPGSEDVFDPVGDAAWGWLSVGELTFFFRDNPDLRAALAVREETSAAMPTVDEPTASADGPGGDETREPESVADRPTDVPEPVAVGPAAEPAAVEPTPAADGASKASAGEPESSAVEPTVAEESADDESPEPEALVAEAEVEAPRTPEHPQVASDNDSPAGAHAASAEESDGGRLEAKAPADAPEPVADRPVPVVEEPAASAVEPEPAADEPTAAEPVTSTHEPLVQQAEAAGMEAAALREIAQAVVTDQNASIVYVQERFSLSRTAARRALDALEALGLVSAPAKNGRRKTMVTSLDHLTAPDGR
ncbi:hypothetical protein CUT44_13230 [Streptomyces carminius]|uniref:FtsK gamma domain-containing protein n=1 Tax=Streptomyces carminius TaxID=2665496 RepID=A0A2M8LZD6_9ACTN|nr:DNA translocase FtsK [Streptomyces carminius]PJE97327.1 hypothetical protein CUT44_13230 [Streptomyces carminius]